ncbi:MAG TPA: lysine--tRNA ligase, partial [Actinomycetota bacterium]|nr:lysine--tRNA ligase [Actinomycetota bacterium]
EIRQSGINPYPNDQKVGWTTAGARRAAGEKSAEELERAGIRVDVAGRIVAERNFGKATFVVIEDRAGRLQAYLRKDKVGEEAYSLFRKAVDVGDIVWVEGPLFITRTGELTVQAERFRLLSKALRPLPEKWHGLRDPDLQQRYRYLQLATDLGSRRIIDARATTLKAMRAYLDERGFMEVETPVLQPVAGGAMARPFTTFHQALGIELKLRISLELYLKRLLVGGMERVYEIGHNFRNEGIGPTYNPEFTMLEAYQAYGDYHSMMQLAEELLVECARAVRGSLRFPVRGRVLDLTPPWRRITVLGSVSDAVSEEITLDRSDLAGLAERHGVAVDPAWGPGKLVQEMFEKLVEETLFDPTIVCDFPQEVSPLARPHRVNPGLTEHFDLVIAGIELATAFSELTDPDEQRARFEAQARAKAAGEEEAHPLDEGFIRALEQGMPPAGGIGIGVDRLLMILLDVPSIRDVILFPQMRPEEGRD